MDRPEPTRLISPSFKTSLPATIALQVLDVALGVESAIKFLLWGYLERSTWEHNEFGFIIILHACFPNRATLKAIISRNLIPLWHFGVANLSQAIQCINLLSQFPLYQNFPIKDVSFLHEPLESKKQLILWIVLS